MSGGVFGRDAELSVLDTFVGGLSSAPAALVLAGAPGAGKTTLLRAGVERAGGLGYTVVQTTPSPSDVRLAFAGLADLLGSRLEVVLPGLPAPQRRALGAALLIEDAPAVPPEPHVIAAAVRTALLALAAPAPVVVVVDDVQWLDPPTRSAVGFALRRLEQEHVGLLCAQRTDGPGSELPLELGRGRFAAEILPVGGLSLGALHHLLRTRLGLSLPHRALRRVHAHSAGNPFIALEIGRALARRGITRVADAPLPIPDTLNGLVRERLGELPGSVADALGVVAVMPGAPVSRYLAAGVPGADLDAAVRAGVVEADAGTLRFSHPLLAWAVLAAIPPARQRELHALAAENVADAEERTRHRALAADAPSGTIAAELDGAARTAERRGAPATAAELLELAASLTPDGQVVDTHRRLLTAGKLRDVAGETRAAEAVLTHLAAITPPGPRHAEVIAHLGWHSEDNYEASTRLLEQALAEADGAPALCASIHAYLSDHWAIRGNPARSRTEAHRALAFAERAGDPALLASLLAHAFFCDWRCDGRADERLLQRALDLEHHLATTTDKLEPPSQVAGLYLMQVGRLDEAQQALERALAWAQLHGVEYVRSDILLRLSLVASRRGDPRRGAELAQAGLELAEQLDLRQLTSAQLYGCGFAALQLGQPGAVRDFARRGQELSREIGDRVYLRAHQALLGSLDLALGDFTAAAARLQALARHMPELGRRFESDYGPETAEALIGAGKLNEAASLLAGLEERCPSPVTAAAAARCRAVLAAAHGAPESALAEFTHALELHDQTGFEPVQRGRTLLMLGMVQRRLKQRRTARQTLSEAMTTFENAQSALWAGRAREELARISGPLSRPDELTATERRVAELITQGMSNQAAATELVVTVRAIESTLTKIYAKLGVKSRTQLASHLRDRP